MEVTDNNDFDIEELKDLPLEEIYPHLDDSDSDTLTAVFTALLVYSENKPDCRVDLIENEVVLKCVKALTNESSELIIAAINLIISLLDSDSRQIMKDIMLSGGVEKLVGLLSRSEEDCLIATTKLLFEISILNQDVFPKLKQIGLDHIISLIPNPNSEIKFSLCAILTQGCRTEDDVREMLKYKIDEQFIPLLDNPDSNIQYMGMTVVGVLAQVITDHELLVELGSHGIIPALLSKMKTADQQLQTTLFTAIQNLTYHCPENGRQVDVSVLEYIVLCIKVKYVEVQDSCAWICIHLCLEDLYVDTIKKFVEKHQVIDYFEVLIRSADYQTSQEAKIAYNKLK